MNEHEERTIQSIFNLWFWNFQNPSLQQFSNLYETTVSILELFNESKEYDGDLKYLQEAFYSPVETLGAKHYELSFKSKVDWNIPQLETIYFRDLHFRTKLGKEYYPDTFKKQETKKIILGEIITVLSIFKLELFRRIIRILVDKKLGIKLSFPVFGMGQTEQLAAFSPPET